MVARGVTYLATNMAPVAGILSSFPLLHLGRYLDLLPLKTLNRFQTRYSKGNIFSLHSEFDHSYSVQNSMNSVEFSHSWKFNCSYCSLQAYIK